MDLKGIPLIRLSSAALVLILFASLLLPRLEGQTAFPEPDEMHEQLIELYASGDAKLADKDVQGAFADFQKAFEYSREMTRLYKESAEYEPVYREQSYHFLERLSSVFLLSGDEANALKMLEPSAAGYDELARVKKTPDSSNFAAEMCGRLAWLQLKNNQPAAAEKSSLRGIELDTSIAWLKTNLAHAWLFTGKTDQAMKLYTAQKNTPIEDGRTFGEAVLADFAEFEKAAINHPDVEKVRVLYSQGAPEKANMPAALPLVPDAENEKMDVMGKLVGDFFIMLNRGQFDEIFDTADDSFREGLTKEEFAANMQKTLASLGPCKKRSLTKVNTNTSLDTGAISYEFPVDATFEKGDFVEEIIVVQSKDGQYRISDYSLTTFLP